MISSTVIPCVHFLYISAPFPKVSPLVTSCNEPQSHSLLTVSLFSEAKAARKHHKKDHSKFVNGGHKICASIKKIIERLLSPREKPPKCCSVSEEIERVAEREGTKVYDKNNRMSMPILESSQYFVPPKRRCRSGDFPPDVVVLLEPLESLGGATAAQP